jgi:UDP:flavonoid glycosyltransferase YjiC (YdhE family)
MASPARALTDGEKLSVALVSPLSVANPVLHWLCRNVNEIPGVLSKIFIPKDAAPEHSNLASWMSFNLSTRSEWDRAVFLFRTPEEAEAGVEMAYALNVSSAVIADLQNEDADFSNTAPRLSYPLGTNVEVLPASSLKLFQTFPFARGLAPSGPSAEPAPQKRRVTFFCRTEEEIVAARGFIDNSFNPFLVQVLTNGTAKTTLLQSGFKQPVFNFSECSPQYVLDRTDILVDLSETLGGDLHAWILTYARSQGVRTFSRCTDAKTIDVLGLQTGGGTAAEFSSSLVNLLQSDPHLRGLAPPTVCENCVTEGARNMAGLLGRSPSVDLEPPVVFQASPQEPSQLPRRVVMMAINGHGLGHAQRVTAVAGALRRKAPDINVSIATFPTCFEFVGARGYALIPMAGRPLAQNDSAVETANLKRLHPELASADTFVFDGGHPYDSVVGLLQNFPGRSIWIRRGLWRQWQDNLSSHEREKYFSHVVRPIEAFAELNSSSQYSSVDEQDVGPVVAEADGFEKVEEFLRPHRQAGKQIVVTMLGSGQAGKREHLGHFVCRAIERYDNVINILIKWPQDTGQGVAMAYDNSIAIESVWGTAFVKQADLVISACGYNTFHECLYYQTPALFIPQSAGWLDDQERRAEAAAERDVAVVIDQSDMLGMRDALDGLLTSGGLADMRKTLAGLDLPSPGAAQLAEMIAHGIKPTG